MPAKKSKVTAVPLDAPAAEEAPAEPTTDAQQMSEVINEIRAEPVAEPVVEAEPVPEPVAPRPKRQPRKKAVVEPVPEPEPVEESSASEQVEQPQAMIHPGIVAREKVVCSNCGKSMTAKTLKYSHVHNCKAKPDEKKQTSEESAPPRLRFEEVGDVTWQDAIHRRMACAREAKAKLREERKRSLMTHAFQSSLSS